MFFLDEEIAYRILRGTFYNVSSIGVDIILEAYKLGLITNEFDVIKSYKDNVDYKFEEWSKSDIAEVIKPMPEEFDRLREFIYYFKKENEYDEKSTGYKTIYSANDIKRKYSRY